MAKLFSATRAKYFNKVLTYTLGYAILSVSKLRRQVMFEQFTLVAENSLATPETADKAAQMYAVAH